MKKTIQFIIQTILLPIRIWIYLIKKLLSLKSIKFIKIEISGKLSETPPASGMINMLKPQPKKFYDLIFELTELYQVLSNKKSKKKLSKLKEILLVINSPEIGWAKTWELYNLLTKIKNTGVIIRAFLYSGDIRSYVVALSSNEIYTSPAQNLDLHGLQIESLYFKGFFDKWNIKPDFIHIGRFKSATERYTSKKGSSFAKKQLQEILNRFQTEIELMILDSRKGKVTKTSKLKNFQKLSPLTVRDAMKQGLIDGVLYEEVLIANICKVNAWDDNTEAISLEKTLSVLNKKRAKLYSFAKTKKLAIIVGEGAIIDSQEETPSVIGMHDYHQAFQENKKNKFDAYLFRWNSPGGSAVVSDLLWRDIMSLLSDENQNNKKKNKDNKADVINFDNDVFLDENDKSQKYKFESLKEDKVKKNSKKKKLKSTQAKLIKEEKTILKNKKDNNNNKKIKKIKKINKKPFFVVSQSDVAASGGYYLSAISKNVFTSPMSITGSIGVLAGKFNVSGLLNKIGVTVDNVKSGENSNIYSPFQSFTVSQKKKLTENMLDMYDLFRYRIHLGRGMTDRNIHKLGEGRVYAGSEAVENKLADYSGGLSDALFFIRKELELKINDKIILDVYPKIKAPLFSKKELMPKFLSKINILTKLFNGKEEIFFVDDRLL